MALIPSLLILVLSSQGLLAQFEVRLKPPASDPGATNRGTVLIRYNSTSAFGSVCDDGWDLSDANVACRMLGFSSATFSHRNSFFGTVSEPYVIESLDCNGDEQKLDDCPQIQFGQHDCNKTVGEDAGVTCFVGVTVPSTPPTTQSGCVIDNSLRIVGGPNDAVGRVEIRRNGVWGTVCDDGFDYLAAQVVCRARCFGISYAKPYTSTQIASGTGNIYLDDLVCSGREGTLEDCPANKTNNDCTHKEDAIVSCVNFPDEAPPPPVPEVICNSANMEISFDRNIYPMLQQNGLTLMDRSASCSLTRSTNTSYVSVYLSYNNCTNRDQSNSTHIIYAAVIKYDVTIVGVITRSQEYMVPVACIIPRTGNASQVNLPVEQTAPPQTGMSSFNAEMLIFYDDDFKSSVVSYPHNVTLGSWLNVGVVLQTDDPELKQIVQNCYATPLPDSQSTPQYPLITDKCAEDSTLTITPINSTMFGFRVQSFKFSGNYSYVYLHCEVFVCLRSTKTSTCDQSCETTRRRKRSVVERGDLTEVVSGPIVNWMEGAIDSLQTNRILASTDESRQDNQLIISNSSCRPALGGVITVACVLAVAGYLSRLWLAGL